MKTTITQISNPILDQDIARFEHIEGNDTGAVFFNQTKSTGWVKGNPKMMVTEFEEICKQMRAEGYTISEMDN